MDVYRLKKILSVLDLNSIKINIIVDKLVEKGWSRDQVNSVLNDVLKEQQVLLSKDKYISHFANQIKPFIDAGYNKYYARRQFSNTGWDLRFYEDAYEKAHEDLIMERKCMMLEKEILHRLISGENKSHIVKVLIEKGWPDDELKKNFESLNHGLKALEDTLHSIDINEYNLSEIKKALIQKGWPNDVVDFTLKNIKDKVEYHRKLQHIQKEIKSMVSIGAKVNDIVSHLKKEGFDEKIIEKMLVKMNVELVKQGDINKLKEFNNIESKRKLHNFDDLISEFDNSKTINNSVLTMQNNNNGKNDSPKLKDYTNQEKYNYNFENLNNLGDFNKSNESDLLEEKDSNSIDYDINKLKQTAKKEEGVNLDKIDYSKIDLLNMK
jgi:SOS response regulatory protein OraA/RecX